MSAYLELNPILLLFLVIAMGFLFGNIKIRGTGLGTAAVLFVGLCMGAINPAFSVPDIIFQIGIILFVYTIGIQSGPAFFESFQKNGWRDIGFILLMLFLSAVITLAVFYFMAFDNATITGIFSGASTNTTALAAVIDMVNLKENGNPTAINNLVIGYTFSYPMGILGVMIAIKIMERFLKVDYLSEKNILRKHYSVDDDLTSRTIEVTNPEVCNQQLRDLTNNYQWNIVFGRIDSKVYGTILTNFDINLNLGDRIVIVGTKEDLDNAESVLGKEAESTLFYDRKEYDFVRIFVSNTEVVGKTLASLNLHEKYQAVITRIRRGDVEMLAQSNTVLELGDRIRFVARRKDLEALRQFFGDSYHKASKVNLFTFGIGMALGLVLGMIEFNLWGGITFKLGYAGGPLIAGLALGALRRTGPLVWSLPYGSNVTLNQLGLAFLLAAVGIQSGHTLIDSLSGGAWMQIFIAGSVVSILTAALSLWVGYRLVKIPYSVLLGFVSNQPAILEFATDITKNRVPSIGYAFMFPISLVLKILFAQLMYIFLAG
jgi:putative transport protein